MVVRVRDVPINKSLKQVDQKRWHIGSFVCELIQSTPPADAVVVWHDHDSTYILRKKRDDETASETFAGFSDEIKLVHEGGDASAIWSIGSNAFCKVKDWVPNNEMEDQVISVVKKIAPQIPTPDVIYSWIETDRSFLILHRMEGCTLRDAWESLSTSQRDSILDTVAGYCDLLAQNTSDVLSGATGKPLYEPYLAPGALGTSDHLGPMTHEEAVSYFSPYTETFPLSMLGEVFHFYHPDLNPSNIIILDGKVAGIIDWEGAGYYPRFWIATKPSVSPGFDFDPPVPGFPDYRWRQLLYPTLVSLGYAQASSWYMEWMNKKFEERGEWLSAR
jgi:hypothetical protein